MQIAVLILIASTQYLAAADKLQEWIDLPAEVHEELTQKLKKSQKYTTEQIEVITGCLEKKGVKQIINCLSDDGLEDALEIGDLIKDEMRDLRNRVCGGSHILQKDRCKQLQKDLLNMGEQLKEKWSETMSSGQAYLKSKTELSQLKKNICDKINKKGCWSWLSERLDLNCNPQKLGNAVEKLQQCRINVAKEVWERLSAQN